MYHKYLNPSKQPPLSQNKNAGHTSSPPHKKQTKQSDPKFPLSQPIIHKTHLSQEKKNIQISPPRRRKNAIQQGALGGHRNSIGKEAQNHLLDMGGQVKVKNICPSSAPLKIGGQSSLNRLQSTINKSK